MDLMSTLAQALLKEEERIMFKNERKKFGELVQLMLTRFPKAVSSDQTLGEPYRSIAFLAAVGQRPLTSLLMLKVLLEAGNKPSNGKRIAEKLAVELRVSAELTTRGGNYKDRVGDLISAFVKMGILESVYSPKRGHSNEEGFRIKESAKADVKAFIDCIEQKSGLLSSLRPTKFEDLLKERFDHRIMHVVKSGTGVKESFEVGKIIDSLMDPKVGASFELALRTVEEIEGKLKPGMETIDIQSLLYSSLRKYDSSAAENYLQTYPEVLSIATKDGESKIVNYKLVKTLIGEEVKLKLTAGMMDKFASTVYNVISRNPGNYQDEASIREYISALVNAECRRIEPDLDSFLKNRLESSLSALNGCHSSLQSDEVGPARVLLAQFLEQICTVVLGQMGYLPFRDFRKNVDIISNLLRQETVKEDLAKRFELNEKELFTLQRTKSIMQLKNTANKKSLEKLANEGRQLVDLCEKMLRESSVRSELEPIVTPVVETLPERVATGCISLDSLLYGGIPKDYSVILMSQPCDERDSLIGEFLESGVKKGEITFYVTIDLDSIKALAEEFSSSFYLFICNPQADAIIRDLPNVFKLKGIENLNVINIALNSALRGLDKSLQGSRRACIRILSDVLLEHHAGQTRRWLTALIPMLRSKGFTTLAVLDSHMHPTQDVHSIIDLFEGEIEIFEKDVDGRKYIRVRRLVNKKYKEKESLLSNREGK